MAASTTPPPGPPPAAPADPMAQMYQMMQAMMGMVPVPQPAVDPSAVPFTATPSPAAADEGLLDGVIRPAKLADRRKVQAALRTGTVLDRLCLAEDGRAALGGIPRGCTCTLAGAPGKGKMRTAIAALARAVLDGIPSVLVVSDESLREADDAPGQRLDLATRLTRIGSAATRMPEKDFAAKVLEPLYVLETRHEKGARQWDAFIQRYRYVIEKIGVRFALIDSVGMLDPSRSTTADNLLSLKTYNHEHGVTCLCVGQIRETTGLPIGGASLMHTCDVVFFLEELSLGSKEMAAFWGGNYRDKIDLLTVAKSVTTPVYPNPVRVETNPETGTISLSGMNPASHTPPEVPE